ncbi:pyridoxal phosphate-dependent aminotransferase [Plebeiibacterium sediminum]|uniref:Aminotransferase n=1 Tax=Plebeiibacterium sediminum TaxID=2992112 RepID=A0AAE3SGZ5_9BACT|nr:aminotransferase class I/II-fold pyridoxal phosphate-dependent enzyme [Plebeiobacterium sediminum]MCW3788821.1 histidinol-phosphate aminotransferase family protein [Plebeiobacterium sediminum]
MINGHGNDIHQYKNKIVADFSTNVFNNPATDQIIDFLKQQVDDVRNYPDCNCVALRTRFASYYQVPFEDVMVCNGSTESFYLVAHLFKNQSSVIFTPSFSEYEDACQLYDHQIEFVSNKESLNEVCIDNKLVWLGNPNNPDSKYYSRSFLSDFIASHPSTVFVVDEAYIDLCSNGETIADLVSEYDNLIVIKSFTKLYAIPGIRLGFIVTNAQRISQLKKLHMPWAVNVLAQKAGAYILDHFSKTENQVVELLKNSQKLQKEISQIGGLKVNPSSCSYFLVEMDKGKASQLKDFLINEHGLLIRDASNFRGLNEKCFRVASLGPEKDLCLANSLKEWHCFVTV